MSFPVLNDLRSERIKQNVPIADLSESSGVSEPTLSKIFSGRQDDCRLTTISDIASSLGLEVRAVPEGSLDSKPTPKPVDSELYNRLLEERDKLIQTKDSIIAAQKTYIRVLFYVILTIMFLLILVVVLDRMNGDWGYFRYLAQTNEGDIVTTLSAGTPVLLK